MSVPPLDLDYIRAQFPAFDEPALKDMAFFENAGGSYPCRQVVERLTRFYTSRKVQPYAPYETSRIAGEEMDEARLRLAALLNVSADEVIFGPSTTQNTYVLAQAFRQLLPKGAAIIVTNQDHEANSGAWRRLAEFGFEIREWQIDPETGHLNPQALEALLDDKVKLVCFPHCSNVIGEINDVAAICAKARAAGAWTCVDGVSYAPHGLPDVAALGADIYLFSAYKTYGPHQGIMCVRTALLEQLPNQSHAFNAGYPSKRLAPAGPDHAQIAACAGIADYFDAVHAHHYQDPVEAKIRAARVHDLMRAHEAALLQPLLDYLAGLNGVRLLGPRDAQHRAPTVAIDAGRSAEAISAEMAHHGIMLWGGDFYAVRPLKAMGVDLSQGVLRMSFVHYTSPAEVARLIDVLDLVLGKEGLNRAGAAQ